MPTFKILQVKPFIRLKPAKEGVSIPLYNSQAELQLLSKLRSQSYKAYIGQLQQLPSSDISTDLENVDGLDIQREETTLVASSLLPTQREIFLDAVIPRISPESIDDYFLDVVELSDQPIITFNGLFVIDGHHRWMSICSINPRANISVINFVSSSLTPIQFLKLLQGAIVLEEGGLPIQPDSTYDVDIFHSSNKKISLYLEKELNPRSFDELRKHLKLSDTERARQYVLANILSIKYNNLPATGSPSRELMPQTGESETVLDTVLEQTPVLTSQAN